MEADEQAITCAREQGLSDYELARLERIKQNKKMLEELFPEGVTSLLCSPSPSSSSSAGDGRERTPEGSNQHDGGAGRSRRHTPNSCSRRKILVNVRANPSRKARPKFASSNSGRRVTRSMSSTGSHRLLEGKDSEAPPRMRSCEFSKAVRRRKLSYLKNIPIELDGLPACNKTMLQFVVDSSSRKKYDRITGSTCHQCRQKTTDQKTICHNKNCVGVRGQFCGPCLKNRYGEEIRSALMNKEWVCPPCKGKCNCSFCLPKIKGRPPTGILIHTAKEAGYGCVQEYLEKSNYRY